MGKFVIYIIELVVSHSTVMIHVQKQSGKPSTPDTEGMVGIGTTIQEMTNLVVLYPGYSALVW